jgi:hypothetical protein
MAENYDAILIDFSASDWIKNALRSALERDPIDAMNDAEILVKTLKEHLDNISHRVFGAKLANAQNEFKNWNDGWTFYRSIGENDECLPPVNDCIEWIKGYAAAMSDYDVDKYHEYLSIQDALQHHGIVGYLLEACLLAAEIVCASGECCRWPSVSVREIENMTPRIKWNRN